jgi:hypothetical protein
MDNLRFSNKYCGFAQSFWAFTRQKRKANISLLHFPQIVLKWEAINQR